MPKTIEYSASREWLRDARARGEENSAAAEAAVKPIIADVRARGDEALREYTKKFDKIELGAIELPREALESAEAKLSPDLRAALRKAAENIREYHSRQLRQGFSEQREDGAWLGQRVIPLDTVGIYVPGGTALYPSSVLMNAVPARVAGVREIVLCTPPPKTEGGNELLLAAAHIAGVDRVFTVGGAQAVAAMAYGTESVPRVDKITGPGNIYVQTAKRLVYGKVDIDMLAGPSEVLIVADSSADPRFIAADMLAQAEHDVLASAVLATESATLAAEVCEELNKQLTLLPRREIAEKAIRDWGAVVLCNTLDEAVDFANDMAPEHLELAVTDPMAYLGRVRNAASVFLGQYTPEALGDYLAGTNHCLPTGGGARFFSPLGVDSFIKKSSYIRYTAGSLRAVADDIAAIAFAEGLSGHAQSALIRK